MAFISALTMVGLQEASSVSSPEFLRTILTTAPEKALSGTGPTACKVLRNPLGEDASLVRCVDIQQDIYAPH